MNTKICSTCFLEIKAGYFCDQNCQDKYWGEGQYAVGNKRKLSLSKMQAGLVKFGKDSKYKDEVPLREKEEYYEAPEFWNK